MAHAIQQAFNMPLAERRDRHQAMLEVLQTQFDLGLAYEFCRDPRSRIQRRGSNDARG